MTTNDAYLKLVHVYFPKSVVMLLKKLEDTPMTTVEIAEYLRMSEDHAYKLVFTLRQRRVICAKEYRPGTTCFIKAYGLGSKDAPRQKLTQAERSRRWRQKKKAMQKLNSFGAMFA